jgi:hypothetical protein
MIKLADIAAKMLGSEKKGESKPSIPETSPDGNEDLEVALREFEEAKTTSDKVKALRSFIQLAKSED